MDQLKCSLCGSMVNLDAVATHVCVKSAASLAKQALLVSSGASTPHQELESLEDELRLVYGARVALRAIDGETTFEVQDDDGVRVGRVTKRGGALELFSSEGALLKTLQERLVETKAAVPSEVEEDAGLSLLCKVCGGRVPVEVVEKHARVCAISFPVQILRFAHSVEAEQQAVKKREKKKEGDEISCLDDFPQTVLTALDKSGVPRELFAKHLDVLVNVLNFASKMKFSLAENRPSPVRDAATKALRNGLNHGDLQELCKVIHCHGNERVDVGLAKLVTKELENGLAMIRGEKPLVQEKPMSAETEGQKILAAQKEVFNQATKLYDEISERQARKMYKMAKKIGEGGYGKVYVASCLDKKSKLPDQVAIKIMHHDSLDAKARRTNLRELLYLSRLKHPNIVNLHCAHLVDSSSLWLVLEFMEGGTLREASKCHVFDEDEVAYCAFEMIKGVQFMHGMGTVHRDIKSHNVMLTVKGEVKLIDLGLVADVKHGISTMRGILGTTYWIPPEMIRGEKHSYPADIWSMGICLLELMHGYPPNRDNKLRALFLAGAGVAPSLEDPSKWSSECHDFFNGCLVPEQTERATADDLIKHAWLNKRCELPKIIRRLRDIFVSSALTEAGFF